MIKSRMNGQGALTTILVWRITEPSKEMDHYHQQQYGHGGYDQNHGGHEEYVIGTTTANGEEPAYYQQFNNMSVPAQAEEMMRNSYDVNTPVQGRRHSSKDEIANEAAHAMLHLDGANNQGQPMEGMHGHPQIQPSPVHHAREQNTYGKYEYQMQGHQQKPFHFQQGNQQFENIHQQDSIHNPHQHFYMGNQQSQMNTSHMQQHHQYVQPGQHAQQKNFEIQQAHQRDPYGHNPPQSQLPPPSHQHQHHHHPQHLPGSQFVLPPPRMAHAHLQTIQHPNQLSPSQSGKAKKRKRPADMPKRPLSAYNFFFSEERVKVLASLPDPTESKEGEVSPSKVENGQVQPQVFANGVDKKEETSGENASENTSDGQQNTSEKEEEVKVKAEESLETSKRLLEIRNSKNRKRRPHRKSHGKIAFKDLAKEIGRRWKALSEDQKKPFNELADKDLHRYNEQMKEFNSKKNRQYAMVSYQTTPGPLPPQFQHTPANPSGDRSFVQPTPQEHFPQPPVEHNTNIDDQPTDHMKVNSPLAHDYVENNVHHEYEPQVIEHQHMEQPHPQGHSHEHHIDQISQHHANVPEEDDMPLMDDGFIPHTNDDSTVP